MSGPDSRRHFQDLPNLLTTMKYFASLVLFTTSVGVFGLVRATAAPPAGQVFNVRDAGATGDGKTLDTAAIQKALNDSGKAGGGTVLFPAGTYLSQPLTIRTKTTLQLDKGATLKAT